MTLDEIETLLRADRPKDDSRAALKVVASFGALIFGMLALFYFLAPLVIRLFQF